MPASPTRFKSYLQLIRLPNVFTAAADSFAGFLLVGGALGETSAWLPLVFASMAIYAGGIALNDVFDVEIDRRERPNRPIPSGRVPYRSALILSLGLMGIGFGLTGSNANRATILVALALIAAVVAYDGLLRTTKIGPFVMGLCRALNFLLGMVGALATFEGLPWLALLGYFGFVAGVTWVSRNEASGEGRGPLRLGIALQTAAFVLLGLAIVQVKGGTPPFGIERLTGLLLILGIAILVIRKDLQALRAPEGRTIQLAVKTAIFSMVWLHVGLTLGIRGFLAGLLVSLFWFPAMYAGRWIYST